MQFNDHSRLAGLHAFLSASNYHWIGYDDEKLDARFVTQLAAQRGTELHDFAQRAIRLKIKMPRDKKTLSMYVNDAIGFRMTPEVTLLYSENAFGTCDAISFRKNQLRIFDLKTGVTLASFKQLLVYVAFFCLEYGLKPFDIELIELRIYQSDEVRVYHPENDEVFHVMDRIITFDKRIKQLRLEAEE